ncbi:MAG TPA: amino acid adenylation domain-containing protein [Thermoanaerobaculia bacterium]
METEDAARKKARLAARRAGLPAGKRAELERLLKQGDGAEARVIPRRAQDEPSPLSFPQERLWFLDQLEPDGALYNLPVVFRLAGPLRVAALAQALAEVVRRHESLRTRFVPVDGRPLQVVEPARPLELPVVDLRHLSPAEREGTARRLTAEEIRQPFDLAAGSLLRVTLLRLDEREHRLVVVLHHIVSDGWSLQVLIRETGTFYRGLVAGAPARLPELPIQYGDYASWQREKLQGEALAGELAYWRRQLDGLPPVLPLPTDRPRPAAMGFQGETRRGWISEDLTGGLRALSQDEGVTPFVTLLASFQILMSRYTGQEDLAVGIPVAGRRWVETEGLIGFFINTLVIRGDLAGDPPLRELLGRTREVVLEAQSHQDLPFEKLVEELRPERSLSHSPLFQVMFVFQNVPKTVLEVEELSLGELDAEPGVEKFDLTLTVAEEDDRLVYSLGYSTELFEAATIDRMLGHWRRVLETLVARPEATLWEMPLLSDEERRQALWEWNAPERVFAGAGSLVDRFEAQAAARPGAVALSCEGVTVRYGELNARANRLAHALRGMGVGPETCVALCLERSLEMIVAILGVLKAGGAYVPLDPVLPAERLGFLLDDTRAPVLVTQGGLAAEIPAGSVRVLRLDGDAAAISRESADNPGVEILPDQAAYVIFTSGSTGRPKGVIVSHRNVERLFAATGEWFGFDERDVWTLFHSYAFDFSVWELWGALLNGGRCVVVPYWVSRSPEAFFDLLRDEEVTVLSQTPSAFLQLIAAEEARPDRREPALRHVVFGGERLPVQALRPWFERHGDRRPRLVNMYGITETTVHVTYRPLAAADAGGAASVIGAPIPDLQVHLVDARLQLVPLGVAGEMLVGGAGLSRGYLGRPDLTAERFVPDPFSPLPGARLYRSGDLARRRADGDLEYLGRADQQVKIRGHRIEPGEIEEALRRSPAVRNAVVLAPEDSRGGRRLVAYVVPQEPAAASPEELQDWLRGLLPDYMLPAAWVLLDEIPLTANGKLDLRALPEAGAARDAAGFVAPRTPVEEVLAAIWSEVLGVMEIGRGDDFFALGGHSLLATRVLARIREALAVDLPVRALFETPTLSGFAERVAARRRERSGLATTPVRRAPRDAPPSLSYAQQRLWFLDQLSPGSSAYSIPAAVQLDLDLDPATLKRSLDEVVRRHEILRTTFVSVVGQPQQVIAETAEVDLPLRDLSGLAEEECEAEARRLALDESLRPFDLSRGPLLRVTLLRLGEGRHRLLLTLHHIISDGWSIGVLMGEVEALYAAFAAGEPSPLAELEIQYADYAVWQRDWLQGELLETELAYWRRQLVGAPTVIELSTDRPRPAARRQAGAHCPVVLPGDLSAALRTLSRREGATLFMTLTAVFQALLGRYTGQDDILIGTPIAGRGRLELENLIGFFVNMVVLRAGFQDGPRFRDLLRRVRESALGAYTHQDLPFDKLVEELQPTRGAGRNPLFQVILSFQDTPTAEIAMAGVTLLTGSPGSAETKFDLELYLWDGPAGIAGSLVYSPELFEAATIRRMADHFQRLFERLVAEPEASVFDFTLMGEAEIHHVLAEWNDTAAAFPRDACIHELFEEQAGRTPDAVAVQFEQERLTYRELDRRANRLAHFLQKQGVGPEVFVGVLLERSVELVVALLGIAKAGGVYVPVNIADPARRISFILEDAGVRTLLTIQQIAGELPEHELTVVCLDRDQETLAAEPEEPPVNRAMAENLAYMLYTSGSTGLPKGTCITHRNVVKLVKAADYATIDSRQVFLQFVPVSFDVSTFEIWGPLLNGARLVLFPPHMPTLTELGDFVARSELTTLWLTAGLFHQMVDENLQGLKTIGQLLAGGEALSGAHVDRVLAELPDLRLINGYGPTETTTFACCYQIEERSRTSVPIGRPISNTRVYLLNRDLRLAAIGERAELFIGGEGLARGYLNRPDLTAGRFLPDPFGGEPGGRLYRTGDVVRLLADGLIEFLGRVDHQIKIRGFRIELGEIEAALASHPAVRESVILAREDAPGDKRLVAYVVVTENPGPGSEALKTFLRERLPDYMVPSVCIILEALPLTANGKVDRAALPAPDRALLRSERAFVPPRDALQQELVEIWESLLGIRPIGVRDDFFELGGHSLLMVQLIARVEERLGKRVPMAALLQGATIDHLSQLLREEVAAPAWSLLVPLQPEGSRPPLFCVHPAGGNVFCYSELARHLGEEQPFYGIQAREASNKDLAPHTRIEAMAAEYVEAVRAFQPAGPYRLGGWSMGAVIAFEMARQLRRQGQEIALLALMDVEAPSEQPTDYTWAVLLGSFALDLGLSFDRLRASWDEIAALPPMGQLSRIAVEAKAAGLVPADIRLAEFRKLFDAFKTNAQVMRSYAGGPYEGQITLLNADNPLPYIGKELPSNYHSNLEANPIQDGVDLRDPTRGWSKLAAGGVELHTVSGDHYSMVREPHVRTLAERIAACLENSAKES